MPSEILAILSEDDHRSVRQEVAANPSTPQRALSRLANDPDESVRGWVATNPSAPADALNVLVRHPDEGSLHAMYVATHEHVDVATLTWLASHANSRVRRLVAMNPRTQMGVREMLSQDHEPKVRWVSEVFWPLDEAEREAQWTTERMENTMRFIERDAARSGHETFTCFGYDNQMVPFTTLRGGKATNSPSTPTARVTTNHCPDRSGTVARAAQ